VPPSMPQPSLWFIRSGILCLVLALLLSLGQAATQALGAIALFSALGPTILHLFTVGWVTQLIFGVAYWMFPRYSRSLPHGSPRLAWFTFFTLNLGLLLRVFAEPLHAIAHSALSAWLLVASAILQWFAALAFVLNTWARVRER
jgi:hypothetical protein